MSDNNKRSRSTPEKRPGEGERSHGSTRRGHARGDSQANALSTRSHRHRRQPASSPPALPTGAGVSFGMANSRGSQAHSSSRTFYRDGCRYVIAPDGRCLIWYDDGTFGGHLSEYDEAQIDNMEGADVHDIDDDQVGMSWDAYSMNPHLGSADSDSILGRAAAPEAGSADTGPADARLVNAGPAGHGLAAASRPHVMWNPHVQEWVTSDQAPWTSQHGPMQRTQASGEYAAPEQVGGGTYYPLSFELDEDEVEHTSVSGRRA